MNTTFECPDVGDTVAFVRDETIVFLSVDYDAWPENPTGPDSYEIFHSNPRRGRHTQDAMTEALHNGTGILLSYHEHGKCMWYPSGTNSILDADPWDTAPNVGVIVLPDDIPEDLRMEYAKGCCEEYTAWCNGHVYVASVHSFRVRKSGKLGEEIYDDFNDYRFEDPIVEETFGGFYGWSEEFEAECESLVEYAFKF